MTASSTESRAGDLWGGLAAMLVALPSAIAFGVAIHAPFGAGAASLGAVAGMLGAVVLGVVNPLLGGTQGLVSAPCAPAAAVMGALAGELARSHDAPTALLLLGLVGAAAGILQIGFGAAGGGKVIKYIPYPVVAGYLSGVAILIVVKQLPPFLGVAGKEGLWAILTHPSRWSVPSVVVGSVTVGVTFLAPRFVRAVPGAIVGLVAGVGTYFALSLGDESLRTLEGNRLVIGRMGASVGALIENVLERGAGVSQLTVGGVASLVGPAVTLAALLSIDTLKTCVVVDAITGARHESNRELRAQGIGNLLGGLLGGVPGAGTSGATLVNVASGGRTRLSGVVEGGLCLLAFLVLGDVVAWIPLASLSGILFVVAVRMIDKESFALLRHRSTLLDFSVILAVVVVAIAVGLIEASAAGVGLAILLFFREHMRTAVVRRRTTGDRVFSRKRRLPEQAAALEREGHRTTFVELQGNLFFGTTDKLFTELAPDLATQEYVILDLRRVHGIDYTAARLLDQMDRRLHSHGGRLVLGGAPSNVPSGRNLRGYLATLQLGQQSGGIEVFDDADDALAWVEDRLLEEARVTLRDGGPLGLEEVELFEGFEQQGLLEPLAACVEERSFGTGEVIFRAGDVTDEVMVVRRGAVSLQLSVPGGASFRVASVGRGDFFGEIAFLERSSRTADAVADEPTELYVLSRGRMDELSRQLPLAGVFIFARLARTLAFRLRAADAEIGALRSD